MKVAVKCIAKHDILRRKSFNGTQEMCLEEYEILSGLKNSHENIINLLDVYETEDEIQLVMEYITSLINCNIISIIINLFLVILFLLAERIFFDIVHYYYFHELIQTTLVSDKA